MIRYCGKCRTTIRSERELILFSLSKRSDVEPFHAMDVLAEATLRRQAGHPVISMAVGQPSHPAPQAALEAARAALGHGRIGYTDALGTLALRQALSAHYQARHGLSVDPKRIAITTGSSAGFNLAFLTLFDAGDSVAIARPGYPAYRNILAALGLDVVEVPVTDETQFTLTPESLEAAQAVSGKRLKGVLLASPANPTGTVTGRAALKALADYCADRSIAFISDEIYHGLDYAFPAVTAAELSPQALVINSFSKYFCMTGWRVGWMVVPEPLVRPIERLQQNFSISVPTLSQIAAEAAFEGRDEMEAIKRGYQENRRILIDGLPKAGLTKFLPADGAFYLYADVSDFTSDSFEFASRMLENAHVAVTPGVDFDPVHGRSFIRLSYARSADEMREAVTRIARWLA